MRRIGTTAPVKILTRYVGGGFVLIFVMALAVFTFVMGIGSMIRIIDYVARGVPGTDLGRYFLLSFPFILQYTVPMSAMTASLLLATRLSLDGEISAMKACGMSLWQIVAPVVVASILIATAALYVANWLSPRSRIAQRELLAKFAAQDPLLLIEQGRWIRDFPSLMVYIGEKRGTNLTDVVIYQFDDAVMRSSLRARTGTVGVSPDGRALIVNMYGVRMEQLDRGDPIDPSKARVMVADFYPQRIELTRARTEQRRRKRPVDMELPELLAGVRTTDGRYDGLPDSDVRIERMKHLVEANSRIVMGLSCFAMPLVGIPLGMRSRRRESSIGVLVSLIVIFVFYLFLMVAKSMASRPELCPDLIVWIPVAAAEILGLAFIRRMS